MLRGRRDRYHRLGLPDPVHRRGGGDAAADLRGRRGRPRGLPARAAQVRGDRGACRHLAPTCPRSLGGVLVDGRGPLRDPDPRWRVVAVRLLAATPRSSGLTRSAGRRPADASSTSSTGRSTYGRHRLRAARRWRVWFAFVWWRRRDLPRTPLVPARRGGLPASLAIVCAGSAAGWSPRSAGNRGRSRGLLLTRDAVTTSGQRLAVLRRRACVIYVAVGSPRAVVLRRMRRARAAATSTPGAVRTGESHGEHAMVGDRRLRARRRASALRGLRRRRLRRRLLGPHRRRRERGARGPRR